MNKTYHQPRINPEIYHTDKVNKMLKDSRAQPNVPGIIPYNFNLKEYLTLAAVAALYLLVSTSEYNDGVKTGDIRPNTTNTTRVIQNSPLENSANSFQPLK
jgi:hypothetical protein